LIRIFTFGYNIADMTKSFITALCCLLSASLVAQKVSSAPRFGMGQVFEITLELSTTISQQAMGQSIDFTVNATGDHSYRVTNSTDDNSTLNHSMQRVQFIFDGMGQKRKFDSNEEKDMNGQFGKPLKELLEKKYDMVVDPAGKTLMTLPDKIELTGGDSRMAIIRNMMKEVYNLVQPPPKGGPSFFQVLPETETGIGEAWSVNYTQGQDRHNAAFSITDINDSTIIVDFATTAVTVSKAEMMGNETITTMNSKSKGKIILDRATGIIREKTEETESNGQTESSFGTLPVTARTKSTIRVNTKSE